MLNNDLHSLKVALKIVEEKVIFLEKALEIREFFNTCSEDIVHELNEAKSAQYVLREFIVFKETKPLRLVTRNCNRAEH